MSTSSSATAWRGYRLALIAWAALSLSTCRGAEDGSFGGGGDDGGVVADGGRASTHTDTAQSSPDDAGGGDTHPDTLPDTERGSDPGPDGGHDLHAEGDECGGCEDEGAEPADVPPVCPDDECYSTHPDFHPLYPTHGAEWNDYVVADGSSALDASDTACTGDEPGGHAACLHGGQMRVVEVNDRADCAGLTASDTLGAFEWLCDASTGTVRMISTSLKEGADLSDLLDFEVGFWRPNGVTVKHGDEEVLRTPRSVWWRNPVWLDPNGGALDQAGTLYLVSKDRAAGFDIRADRVALVVAPGATLHAVDRGGDLVDVFGRRFLWIEGAFDVTGGEAGLALSGMRSSVLRRVRVANGREGISMFGGCAGNLVFDVALANNDVGLLMVTSSDNSFHRLRLFNNHTANARLLNVNDRNVFSELLSFASPEGFDDQANKDNVFVNVTVANTGDGIGDGALHVWAGSHNTLILNAAFANNFGSGLYLEGSNGSTVCNAASAHNGISGAGAAAYRLRDSSHNYFTGVLLAGQREQTKHCYSSGGSAAGVAYMPDRCMLDGASDATVTNNLSLRTSFAGKAASDSQNGDGATGSAAFEDIGDWLRFEGGLRGWGLEGGDFPSRDHMAECAEGATCRIWDWSLPATGGVLLGALPRLEEGAELLHPWSADSEAACGAIPGARWESQLCSNPGWTHQAMCEIHGGDWVDPKCVSRVLRNASELMGDGRGNENGLCESGERCLLTPNLGAYQGHGELVYVATTSAGPSLAGITLLRRAANGL